MASGGPSGEPSTSVASNVGEGDVSMASIIAALQRTTLELRQEMGVTRQELGTSLLIDTPKVQPRRRDLQQQFEKAFDEEEEDGEPQQGGDYRADFTPSYMDRIEITKGNSTNLKVYKNLTYGPSSTSRVQGAGTKGKKSTPKGQEMRTTRHELVTRTDGVEGKVNSFMTPLPPVRVTRNPLFQPRARDMKCHKCQGLGHYANQCPNKRTIIMVGNYVVGSASEGEDEEAVAEDEVKKNKRE